MALRRSPLSGKARRSRRRARFGLTQGEVENAVRSPSPGEVEQDGARGLTGPPAHRAILEPRITRGGGTS